MKEICDLRINHYKFADLRTFTRQKFSDLRLRNEPKNFRGLYSVQCPVLRNLVIVMVCAGHVCERRCGATVFSTVQMTKKNAPVCQV
jgi:hypothetical protein